MWKQNNSITFVLYFKLPFKPLQTQYIASYSDSDTKDGINTFGVLHSIFTFFKLHCHCSYMHVIQQQTQPSRGFPLEAGASSRSAEILQILSNPQYLSTYLQIIRHWSLFIDVFTNNPPPIPIYRRIYK
jgi:hypothetical protein